MKVRQLFTLGFFFTFLALLRADVLCPRVLTEHTADVSDLGRFRQYQRWKDKQGEELAIAVWQYLCSPETGLFHMNAVSDGPDPWDEYSTVRDPVKLMNIYNVGYCGIFGPVLDGVFQGVGFADGRAFGLPGWNHCTTEVHYNNGWHYFDLDVRGALMKPDGTIASLAEAKTNRDLWVNPKRSVAPFFPKDNDKSKVFEIYRDSDVHYYYRWFQAGHVMDFRLRQGETFTRYWQPQSGRWHHLPEYNTGFVRKLLEQAPAGFKSNHPEFSVWTQGNGLWQYEPDLTSGSSDFENGAWSVRNLKPSPNGLQLANDGIGEAVFEVFTPWIIVPKINALDDPTDDTEASIITLHAARPVSVQVSSDHGKSWRTVTSVEAEKALIDLTPWVKGTYGYLLKLASNGQASEVVLRSMKIETWVQVAPMSLPQLKSGLNHCRYEVGDRYGRATMPLFVQPNVADLEDLKRYVVEMPRDYDPDRRTARIRGEVVVKVEAPPGALIDWLTVGACFNTHQREEARKTDNRIAYAIGQPENFTELYRAQVPAWVNHWRYQWDQDVLLTEPSKVVFVKYTGNPGLNVIRATLHLKPAVRPGTCLQITHGYTIDGILKEQRVEMTGPGEYIVKVEGNPENAFIRMAVPSMPHGATP
jgi:hypothetical protein